MAVLHLVFGFSLLLLINLAAVDGQRYELEVDKEFHQNCSDKRLPKLLIDTAYVNVSIQVPFEDGEQIELWSQSIECHKCDLMWRATIDSSSQKGDLKGHVCLFDTQHATNLTLRILNASGVYRETQNLVFHMLEGYTYDLSLVHNNEIRFVRTEFHLSPFLKMLPYGPIFVAFLVFVVMAVIWMVLLTLYRRRVFSRILSVCRQREDFLISSDLGSPASINPIQEEEKPKTSKRLKSLDTFRGLCIVIMIFVNYNGGKYWFFRHSRWNGFTVADLVFPWFMFIMGTSMALSFRALLRKRTPRLRIFIKIVRRTIILFMLGMILGEDGGHLTDLKKLRIPGVLQRFAIAYFVNALLELAFAKPQDPDPESRFASVRDIIDFWPEWLLNLGFVTSWLLITFLLPVPGCPKGYLGPGGLHDGGQYYNCTGGAARYIDQWFFGEDHIYGSPTCKELYKTGAHDPEGMLGSLNSIFMTFLGLQMGKIILYYPDYKRRLKRFFVWGVFLGGLGTALCYGEKDDGLIPINKNLWSLTFVLCLAGMAFILFSIIYVLVDVLNIWNGAPFYYPGMNSIMVYTLHITYQLYFPVQWSVPKQHSSLLPLHLWGVSLWCALAFYCHHIGFFITI